MTVCVAWEQCGVRGGRQGAQRGQGDGHLAGQRAGPGGRVREDQQPALPHPDDQRTGRRHHTRSTVWATTRLTEKSAQGGERCRGAKGEEGQESTRAAAQQELPILQGGSHHGLRMQPPGLDLGALEPQYLFIYLVLVANAAVTVAQLRRGSGGKSLQGKRKDLFVF